MLDFNYNTEQEMQPGRSSLVTQVAQRLKENPEGARELTPQLETQIVGSPLTPEERSEVAPTAAGAAAIAIDKQKGLSPRDSILQSLKEGNQRLADEKSKLYEAEASGKELTRGQMVALAMLAMAPLIGRAVGGNMGGVAGGEGAMVAGKLMLGQEQGRQQRAEKRIDAAAEAKDRQMLANDKAALELQTLPLKAEINQDAVLARHQKEKQLGIGNQGTNVSIKVDTEGGKQIVKNQIDAEGGYRQVSAGADAVLQTIDALQKTGEIGTNESIAQAAWRDIKGRVVKGTAGDLMRREQTKVLISQLRKQMGGNPSDYDTKVMNYVTGMDFGVPVQVIKYLAMRAKYLAYKNTEALSNSSIVDSETGRPIQTTKLDLGAPPTDPLSAGMYESLVEPSIKGKRGTPNPSYRKKLSAVADLDAKIAALEESAKGAE
mgnify:CR=1 FL=1